jgi:hypothetical protein
MARAMESGTEQLTVDRFVPPDEKKEGAPSDAKPEEAAKPEAKAESSGGRSKGTG